MNWQPIETAPKDGTLVLLYRYHLWGHHDRQFIAAKWNKEQNDWVYDSYPTEETELVLGSEWASHWTFLQAPPGEVESKEKS